MPLAPFSVEAFNTPGSFQHALHAALSEVFPFSNQSIVLGSLGVRVSLKPQSEWAYGIFHNSPYLIVSVDQEGGKLVLTHCNTTFHRKPDGSTVNLPKVRKINDASLTKIVGALEKWKTAALQIINGDKP